MEIRKTSYLIIALQKLLHGEKLTHLKDAKNSNQYFNIIKLKGIELIEVWKPNRTNRGKHKVRSLNLSVENIKLAQDYLARLKRTK